MKRTKKIGNIIILTVLTVAILFYMLPNVALIEQSLEIKASPDKVFELINRPDNWVEWYTPLKDTSGVKLRFIGTSAGRGAGMKWVSLDADNSTGLFDGGIVDIF